jgi:hypothetical protein
VLLRSRRDQVEQYKAATPYEVAREPTDTPDRVACWVHVRQVLVAISTIIGDIVHNLRPRAGQPRRRDGGASRRQHRRPAAPATQHVQRRVTGWLRRKRFDERAFLVHHLEITTALALRFPAVSDVETETRQTTGV